MTESREISGAYGVPKWMKKKSIRYEVEDFIVSPPSKEEGSYFELRYGRSNSRQSTYEKISSQNDLENEGIRGLGVGGPDRIGGHRERKESIGGTISISSGGIEFDTTPEQLPTSTITFDIGSGPKVDPLFVLPWKYPNSKLKEHETDFSSTSINSNLEDLSTAVQHCQINKEVSAESSITLSFEDSGNRERRRNRSGQRLLDLVAPLAPLAKPIKRTSVNSQDDEASGDELNNIATPSPCVTPFSTPVVTPGVTPAVTPAGSPTRQRKLQKVTGVVMDPSATSMAISSYFFTKPFKSPQDQVESVKRSEQLMEVSKMGGESESKQKMGKQCKPKAKATALREMNFWAPTSM